MLLTLLLAAGIGLFVLSLSIPFKLRFLNLISYQYFLHFIFLVVPGSIAILLGFREDLALIPVQDITVIYVCVAVAWCLIAFPLTITVMDLLLGQNIKLKIIEYKSKPIVNYNNSKITIRNVRIIMMFNVFFLMLFIFLLPVIPIFHIGSGVDFIMNSRLESAFDLHPGVYFLRRVLYYFLPIYFLYLFALNNYIKVGRFLLFFSFVSALFILGYSTEKAPIILFIVSIFFLKNLIGDSYNLSINKLLPLFFFMAFLLILMFIFFYGNSLEEARKSLVSRMFVSQVAGSFLSMEYFGSHAEFKYFNAVFFRIDAILGNIPTMQASEELVYYYYPELFNSNLWRNVNSFIIQGAWANFGWLGILFAPIWCAIVIYSGCLYIVNSAKTSASLAVYTYSAIFMFSLSTNFNNFIFSSGFLLTIIIWVFLKKI